MNKDSQLRALDFGNGQLELSEPVRDGAQVPQLAVLALARQSLREGLLDQAEGELPMAAAIRIHASIPDLLRAMPDAREAYLVFSPRPGLIWDQQLILRVAREIEAVEALNVPWFCLCADGMDLDGRQYAAGHFSHEPTTAPDRGRHLIVQTAGTLYVVKTASLLALGEQMKILPDLVPFVNMLITVAYGRGFASIYTSGLFPCLIERRGLEYVGLDAQRSSFDLTSPLSALDAAELFPEIAPHRALLTAWVETLASALRVKHAFSFVIRTLFRRGHMLRRCLISIEYLRSSLDVPVQIVLATDVDEALVEAERRSLEEQFPRLVFTVADGRKTRGHSRVRNLIAGLQATTGTRVCIIDDDDYYTPQAVGSFAQACDFGTECLVIFDTQIIEEKWIKASFKHQREITAYGVHYPARSWAATLRGSNSIPLCGVIHPGWFIREVVQEFVYDFDLSEDFIFHLLCLSHPKRPPIKIVETICAYQSHRAGDDNVSNIEDRTGWTADTANGLYQLLFEQGRAFDFACPGPSAGEIHARTDIAALEAELARANRATTQATRLAAKLIKLATDHAP